MTRPQTTRRALVTGASSGIGRATAALLVQRGYEVIGTSRDPQSMAPDARISGVDYLPLELGDPAAIESCVRSAGPVDVLINNAGESQSGPLEDLPLDAIERVFRLNVFGAVQTTQLVLPGMRERGHGRIVMVGSMLASFPLAYRSSYVASKAALKGFATAARGEVAPYGVHIATVEPGSIATGLSERRTIYVADGSPYGPTFSRVLDHLRRNEDRGIAPEVVAKTVLQAVEATRPRSFYAVGSRAAVMFPVRRLLTEGGLSRMVNRAHGIRA